MGTTHAGPAANEQFRVDRAFAIIVGVVGGLLFVPMSVVGPLDLLQRQTRGEGDGVLLVVTGIGWLGLGLIARFIFRPRLVLRSGELIEQRLLTSQRIPLAEVTSIDRRKGSRDRRRFDELFLFRAHPEQPWRVELLLVDQPERAVAAVRAQCPVTFGAYTPQTAPTWLRDP